MSGESYIFLEFENKGFFYFKNDSRPQYKRLSGTRAKPRLTAHV